VAADLTGDPDAPLYHGLKACLEGDGDGEAAVRQLLPRIQRQVRKACPALGGEAPEIAVIVIERVCERLDTFRGPSTFFGWVSGITRNVMRERLRHRDGIDQGDEPFPEYAEAEDAHPEAIALDQMEFEVNCLLVEESLASLPDLQRTILIDRVTKNVTSAQIGENLGRSVNAVRHALVDAHAAVARWQRTKGY
jgi:RNA polymerase sigma factor (sigma-70 family)